MAFSEVRPHQHFRAIALLVRVAAKASGMTFRLRLRAIPARETRHPRRPEGDGQAAPIKTRAAVQKLTASAKFKRERLLWIRLEFALFLANATGRRRGAIVGLRVDDFDFAANRITWRAEYDNKGVEWVVPMPIDIMAEIANGHDIEHSVLIQRLKKHQRGELTDDDHLADQVCEYEAQIAALEWKVGQLSMELDALKRRPRVISGTPSGPLSLVPGPTLFRRTGM